MVNYLLFVFIALGSFHCYLNGYLRLLGQNDQRLNGPDMIRQPRFHSGSHAERLVDTAKVVVHEVQRDHVTVVLQFLTKRADCEHGRCDRRQPRIPSPS